MRPPLYLDRHFTSLEELFGVLTEQYWHRAPVVFRNHGLRELLWRPADVLEGLRSVRRQGESLRIYTDGKRHDTDVEMDYCQKDDASIEQYIDRLTRKYGSNGLAVVLDFFERSHPHVWFRCAQFLKTLYQTIGFPVGFASVNLFAGNYTRTPFGFHKDVSDSFMFAITGEKRYLVWDYDTVTRHLRVPDGARHENIRYERFDYTRLMPFARVIETQPGDLVYWPWDCFHIGEPNEGKFSVSMALGTVPFASPLAELDAASSVAKRASYAMRSEPFQAGAQPDPAVALTSSIQQALNDEAVRDIIRERLLLRRSRFGFTKPLLEAESGEEAFDDEERLHAPLPDLVAWTNYDNGLLVAVNGYSFTADEHPGLIALLTEVNRGIPLRVGDLRAKLCATEILDHDELDQVLGCLVRFRALEREVGRAPKQTSHTPTLPSDLFQRSGLFPLRLADDGASVLLAPISDEQHRQIEGFDTRAYRVPLRRLFDLYERHPPRAHRARYVLTQGYSGSTFLCRCIEAMPRCFAIHEPQVLGDWSLRYGMLNDPGERRDWLRALELLTALLFRSTDPDARVVVKVGPHVMEVVEELFRSGGQPMGVHLYTSLPAYLANTLKDPIRRADVRSSVRTPRRAAMIERIGAPRVDVEGLSDARAIVYIWLTDLELYRWLRPRPEGAALRALDFDGFLHEPARGLRALSDHLDLGLPPGGELELSRSEVFSRHAKPGRAKSFDKNSRSAAIVEQLQKYDAEIRDGLQWARELWGGALPERLGDELLNHEMTTQSAMASGA